MRLARLLPLILLLAATPARAQYGGDLRPREPRRPPTHADSTRSLEGAWQVWGHAGIGWLGSPEEVRSRYHAGIDAGLSGDRRFFSRLALRGTLGFHDLPSNRPNVVFVDGVPYPVNESYGHGWLAAGTGGVAVRTWKHLWLEGSVGGAHFHSGLGEDQVFINPVTGDTVTVSGGSGSGPAWGVGVRYEFKPTLRDRILGEVQFLSVDRGGEKLRFWAVRVGYRAF